MLQRVFRLSPLQGEAVGQVAGRALGDTDSAVLHGLRGDPFAASLGLDSSHIGFSVFSESLQAVEVQLRHPLTRSKLPNPLGRHRRLCQSQMLVTKCKQHFAFAHPVNDRQ